MLRTTDDPSHHFARRVPAEIRTDRLLLRPWNAGDATELHPILVDNYDRLSPWIPARVAEPGTIASLSQRLAGFAADFEEDREWRYCLRSVSENAIVGEVALFPRDAAGRNHAARADRAEIGYWLRGDAAGRGYASEAARAMIDLTASFPRFLRAEIRCDARNAPSAAIPRKLGFTLEPSAAVSTEDGAARDTMQVWTLCRDDAVSRPRSAPE